jgi:hypothetical protein
MRKLPSAKDSKAFWDKVTEEDRKYRLKQSRLPFIKKLEILEELQERTRILRKAKEFRDKKS